MLILNAAIVDCSHMFRLHTAVSIRLNTTSRRKEIILHIHVAIVRDLDLKKVIYTHIYIYIYIYIYATCRKPFQIHKNTVQGWNSVNE